MMGSNVMIATIILVASSIGGYHVGETFIKEQPLQIEHVYIAPPAMQRTLDSSAKSLEKRVARINERRKVNFQKQDTSLKYVEENLSESEKALRLAKLASEKIKEAPDTIVVERQNKKRTLWYRVFHNAK